MGLIVFLLRLTVLSIAAFLSAFIYFLIASHYISPQIIEHPLSMLLVGVIATLIFLKPVNYYIDLLRKRLHLGEQIESFERLQKLSRLLLFEKELIPAANLFINSLADELKLDSSALFLKYNNRFHTVYFQGHDLNAFKGFALTEKSPLIYALSQRPDGLKGLGPNEPMPSKNLNTLSGELHRLQTAYAFPLFRKSQLIGFLSVGFKSEHSLSRTEIRFIKSIMPVLSSTFYVLQELDNLAQKLKNLPGLQSNLLQTAKYSALEQLATGIAHEIHNPLTIISGKAQVLLLRKSKNFNSKQVEEALENIVKQTKRASDVTRKLLMFTKVNKSDEEELDLETVLRDTMSLISYQSSLDQVTLEKNIAPNLPKIMANQAEIREIFMNLILNAIKVTPEKGKVRITLRTGSAGERIEFCVEDFGPGISKEDMDRIFDPFYTSEHENLGLGLYITERLVFKNKGKIYAESEKGHGSLFIVELPCDSAKNVASQDVVSEVV